METRFDGSITVSRLGGRVILAVGRGRIGLEQILAAQAEFEILFRSMVGTIDVIYDGTEVVNLEPGMPIRWVRWGAAHAHRAGLVAIVARSGPMMAVAKTVPYLMPSTRFATFTDRATAIAYVNAANAHT